MNPARNVLITTHVLTGLVGVGLAGVVIAIRGALRSRRGAARANEMAVYDLLPDELLGALTPEEFERLKQHLRSGVSVE